MPHALKAKTDTELEHFVEEGVYVPLDYLGWAVPIVLVLKSDGTVNIW